MLQLQSAKSDIMVVLSNQQYKLQNDKKYITFIKVNDIFCLFIFLLLFFLLHCIYFNWH